MPRDICYHKSKSSSPRIIMYPSYPLVADCRRSMFRSAVLDHSVSPRSIPGSQLATNQNSDPQMLHSPQRLIPQHTNFLLRWSLVGATSSKLCFSISCSTGIRHLLHIMSNYAVGLIGDFSADCKGTSGTGVADKRGIRIFERGNTDSESRKSGCHSES